MDFKVQRTAIFLDIPKYSCKVQLTEIFSASIKVEKRFSAEGLADSSGKPAV